VTQFLRPRALAALLAVLAVTLVGAGCGADRGAAGSAGSSGDATALLERALGKQKTVASGDVALDLKADGEGIEGLQGPLELRAHGPFKSGAERKLPSLDWDIDVAGGGLKLSGGLIATDDNAFLRFQGRSYELGRDAFAKFARRLEAAHPDRQRGPGLLGMDPASWLEDPKVEDGAPVGGEATRKITGPVDVHKAIGDVVDLIESPALRKKLERGGGAAPEVHKPTDKDLKEIEDAIKRVDVEVNVDKNDVLRRFFTKIDFKARNGGGKVVQGRLSLSYVLRKVGGNPVIRAPSDARPLKELLGGFGLGGLGSGLYGKRD
jgi:hypothetical protein